MLAENWEIPELEDVRLCIFPMVMTRSEFPALGAVRQERTMGPGESMKGLPHTAFGEFQIGYLMDWSEQNPQSRGYDFVTREDLEAWGISPEQLREIAMDNLSRRRLHVKPLGNSLAPWDEGLTESLMGERVYQLTDDFRNARSCALDMVLLTRQLEKMENSLEKALYLVLCTPSPLMIPRVSFMRTVDFDRIYAGVCASSHAPEALFSRDVYLFERGRLWKTGNRISF